MKTMCGGLFSFCFLHETFFGNGQIAITHNVSALAAVAIVRYHQQAVSAIAPMLLLGVVAIIL